VSNLLYLFDNKIFITNVETTTNLILPEIGLFMCAMSSEKNSNHRGKVMMKLFSRALQLLCGGNTVFEVSNFIGLL